MTSQCECASLSDYAGQGSGICEWCEAQNLTSAIGEALDDAICNGDGRPTAKHLLVELERRGLVIVSAGAIQAEREECAKTICLHCREGRPVARRGIDLWLHGFDSGDGYECHPCSAYAVRERAIASAHRGLGL